MLINRTTKQPIHLSAPPLPYRSPILSPFPMSTCANFTIKTFLTKSSIQSPHTVLPTYILLLQAQRQLSANAAAIPSLNRGGACGHTALTLTATATAELSNIPFIVPVPPPAANPLPGTTQPQITEIIPSTNAPWPSTACTCRSITPSVTNFSTAFLASMSVTWNTPVCVQPPHLP